LLRRDSIGCCIAANTMASAPSAATHFRPRAAHG